MPTYDYRCRECKYEFEEFQSITAERLVECPKCSAGIDRLVGGGTGLIFKGSGFYITDYKGANGSDSSTVNKDSKNNSSKNASGKPESKSETKTKPDTTSDSK